MFTLNKVVALLLLENFYTVQFKGNNVPYFRDRW